MLTDLATIAIIEQDCSGILKNFSAFSLRNKRVLVTGASGFLGQYIVGALRAANQKYKLNCKITCVGLRGPSEVLEEFLDKNISFKKIDLSKPFRIDGKFDYIFHAAGYGQPSKFVSDPFSTVAVNIDATRTLLEIAERSRGTFIFFSSAEVYGEMPQGIDSFKETYPGIPDVFGPRGVYQQSKRLGESLCLAFERLHKTRIRIVRISHTYGPGPKGDVRVMSDFIRKARRDGVIRLLDAGAAVKTYGYLADVVSMILFVAFHGKETVYNVGGRDTVSIRHLAERIGKICGAAVVVPQQKSKAAFVGRDPGFVKLNLTKILKEMKKFSFTPFRDGLVRTVEAFEE